MNKTNIFNILDSWNEWSNKKDIGFIRNFYLDKLHSLIQDSNQIITITGPRRAGKSYIMRQMAKVLSEYNTKQNNILFVNFDDPRFLKLDTELLIQIYDTYLEFMSPTDTPYIFLDEVQEVDQWEKWVRMMHELKKAKIIVSGSNAHLLSRELGTLLTGRHLDLNVSPLSFNEYLMFKDVTVETDLDLTRNKTKIKGYLRKYMEHGSFPEVVLSNKKTEILLNYFDDLVNKDLMKRFRIRKINEMKALIKFYLSNTGNLITFSSTGKYLNTNPDTIERFSEYLENVYLIFQLKRFSYKVKEQDKSPRKIYSIDPGLCNSIGFRFSENIGRLAENIVFLSLKRKQMADKRIELFYWKDEQHREVDFIIKENLNITTLIQVCWNMCDEKTKNRELRSLKKAMKEIKVNNALIITEDDESKIELNGFTVKTIPLWKWLLKN